MNNIYTKNDLYLNNIRYITSNSNLTSKDSYLICNTSDDITLQLPSATGSRKMYLVKNTNDTGTVTLQTTGADLIDYISGYSTWLIYMYESVTIIDYDVNNWVILDATIWWPFWFGDGV
jgi:hypothetical protein